MVDWNQVGDELDDWFYEFEPELQLEVEPDEEKKLKSIDDVDEGVIEGTPRNRGEKCDFSVSSATIPEAACYSPKKRLKNDGGYDEDHAVDVLEEDEGAPLRRSKRARRVSDSTPLEDYEEEEEEDGGNEDEDEEEEEEEAFEVERILAQRVGDDGVMFYEVEWKGYNGERTWEPEWNLHCPDILRDFLAENGAHSSDLETSSKLVKTDADAKVEEEGDGILTCHLCSEKCRFVTTKNDMGEIQADEEVFKRHMMKHLSDECAHQTKSCIIMDLNQQDLTAVTQKQMKSVAATCGEFTSYYNQWGSQTPPAVHLCILCQELIRCDFDKDCKKWRKALVRELRLKKNRERLDEIGPEGNIDAIVNRILTKLRSDQET